MEKTEPSGQQYVDYTDSPLVAARIAYARTLGTKDRRVNAIKNFQESVRGAVGGFALICCGEEAMYGIVLNQAGLRDNKVAPPGRIYVRQHDGIYNKKPSGRYNLTSCVVMLSGRPEVLTERYTGSADQLRKARVCTIDEFDIPIATLGVQSNPSQVTVRDDREGWGYASIYPISPLHMVAAQKTPWLVAQEAQWQVERLSPEQWEKIRGTALVLGMVALEDSEAVASAIAAASTYA